MSNDSTGNIVVGVDGSDAGLAAARFAAVRAKEDGVGVHIVHVLPYLIPMSPMLPFGSVETFPELGERIVDTARIEAEKAGGAGLRVTTAVVEGRRAAAILEEAEGARLIVLGHARRARGHVFTDRTVTSVTAHALCAVVTVPEDWHEQRAARVVVGIAETEESSDSLQEAFTRAAELGASLTIVHAWKIDNAYEDIIFERVELEEIRQKATATIEKTIAGLCTAFPAVDVDVAVEHAQPAPAILSHAEDATLLVLGRRSRHGFPDLQLGSTTRAVVRHATCPVEVVPVGASRGAAS